LSAAIEAASSGANVACFEGGMPGGLVANVGRLDDFPAAADMAGATLATSMLDRATGLGVSFVQGAVTELVPDQSAMTLRTALGEFEASATIIATGGRLRHIGVPGEKEFEGRGVSQCDWCDGSLFRDKSVVVVGGGDSALQAALHLAQLCRAITIVARSPRLRAHQAYVMQAADNERIEFAWETVVDAIVGGQVVEKVRLRNLTDGQTEERACSGVFIFAGVEPCSEFLPDTINRDKSGRVVVDSDYRTSIPNVYAVGAVRAGYRGRLVNALGEGAHAAVTVMETLRANGVIM